MTIRFDKSKWQTDGDGMWLALRIHNDDRQKARKFAAEMPNKQHDAELKEHRERRSLDANSYLWALLDRMAEALHMDKWDVYIECLSRYGVFTHVIVKPEAVGRVKNEWRAVSELGPVTVNGKTGVQLQCYYGSHTYDTKVMTRLLDGVISECQEMGIETKTPDEIDRMKAGWGA